MDSVTINDMVGLKVEELKIRDDEVIFNMSEGNKFRFYHYQDCCESFEVEKIENLEALVGSIICSVKEEEKSGETDDFDRCSFTRTTYTFVTDKGTAKISYLGSSNGYYDESTIFERLLVEE